MRVRDRAAEIRGIFFTYCKDIIDQSPALEINESKKHNDCGAISEKLKLIDGSLINFFEIIADGNIIEYSYVDDGIRKPLNHLHVGVKKTADKRFLDNIARRTNRAWRPSLYGAQNEIE